MSRIFASSADGGGVPGTPAVPEHGHAQREVGPHDLTGLGIRDGLERHARIGRAARTVRRTISHLLFIEPYLRLHGTGWERAAREHVAHLRVLLGRYRGDAGLATHIDHMLDLSPTFARMWAEHPVAQVRDRAYVLHHPVVGELTLHGELIALPDEPSCWGLDLFAAEPGSASEQALRILGSLSEIPSA